MAAINTFVVFNSAAETWDAYIARFECFLVANSYEELPNTHKQAYFLSFCGSEVFETAQALAAPQPVASVS